MEIRVVCASDLPDGKVSLGFVTALQDRYGMTKRHNPASLGAGVLDSMSLPFSSSHDAMVKGARETIQLKPFDDRFVELIKHDQARK